MYNAYKTKSEIYGCGWGPVQVPPFQKSFWGYENKNTLN